MNRRELSPTAALELLGQISVVDVREAHEFHGPLGHIEGARLVPLGTLDDALDSLVGASPLLLVSRSGKRSGKACDALLALDIDDVAHLATGMIGWNLAGLPVVRQEPGDLPALLEQIVCWLAQIRSMPKQTAREIVRHRLGNRGDCDVQPSHAAIDDLISFVADSLANVNPPDLDLSLASFRRSLAVL